MRMRETKSQRKRRKGGQRQKEGGRGVTVEVGMTEIDAEDNIGV